MRITRTEPPWAYAEFVCMGGSMHDRCFSSIICWDAYVRRCFIGFTLRHSSSCDMDESAVRCDRQRWRTRTSVGRSSRDGHGRTRRFRRTCCGHAAWYAHGQIAARAVRGRWIREWESRALDRTYVMPPLPRVQSPMDYVTLGSKR
jgi:hypothetical protein